MDKSKRIYINANAEANENKKIQKHQTRSRKEIQHVDGKVDKVEKIHKHKTTEAGWANACTEVDGKCKYRSKRRYITSMLKQMFILNICFRFVRSVQMNSVAVNAQPTNIHTLRSFFVPETFF